MKHEGKTRMPAQTQASHTACAAKSKKHHPRRAGANPERQRGLQKHQQQKNRKNRKTKKPKIKPSQPYQS
ncbi:hypothetical protein [Paraburkholderia terrae]|uniref:hypothetical protein n=1 Tax=Paraburkholderia terrae TaxID=311230 RepID=UPI001EE190B3|nr:hypothetical protein [Paraburkholderia terrae]GJH05616.1 hypothetical protein CBA19C8_33685 [Paraburkholderia terrae]GJH38370.1 hypothetical protein CBA19CS91_36455 [Paraburkholderia hospita]